MHAKLISAKTITGSQQRFKSDARTLDRDEIGKDGLEILGRAKSRTCRLCEEATGETQRNWYRVEYHELYSAAAEIILLLLLLTVLR
jgi:hypothetical protein